MSKVAGPNNPILPYQDDSGEATGGWAGSESSRDRAVRQRDSGVLGLNQQLAVEFVREREYMGATYGDLCEEFGWGHGTASGVLSNLHRDGKLHRLALNREGQRIYVTIGYIGGRKTEPFGRQQKTRTETCPNCNHNFEVKA